MNCRLCGNKKLDLYYTQGNNNEFKFYKCTRCSLVNYDLSAGLNQEKYAEIFIDPFDDRNIHNIGQTQSYQFMREYIPVKGELLDIGCGNGRLLYLAKKDGFLVKGIEISSSLANFTAEKLGIEVITKDFLDFNGSRGSFNVIFLRHVLEHIPEPVKVLKKIHSLLTNNGYAVFEFPNIESMNFNLKRLLGKYGLKKKEYKANYKPGHCCEFSRKSFQYLAAHTNFKIIVWKTYSYKRISNFFYQYIKVGNKVRTIVKK
jgi:2-polyprenyl-3-methyl-5-hydroxy-6-metoxy-1,4-benzoquinol methylase